MSRFEELSKQIQTMQEAGLEDSPMYGRLVNQALAVAPDSLKSYVTDKAVREGWLPQPVGVDQNGERLWRLGDIAAHFGLSAEEATASLKEFQEEHGAIPPIETVHRLH